MAGDDGSGICVDIEKVLVDFRLRRVGKAPAERNAFPNTLYPHTRISIPALEQRARLISPLGPENAQMAFAGNIKSRMHSSRGRQRERDHAAQPQARKRRESQAACKGTPPLPRRR